MELAATAFSSGWASGINAYGTVLMFNLLGRAGIGEVPDQLQGDTILIASAVLYAIEFITDKIPYVDSAWDTIHTAIRPAIGSYIGLEFGEQDATGRGVDEILSAAGAGSTALVSHALKAGIRLGINASPEPASNIIASLTEDGLVAGVVALTVEHPYLAASVAGVLLVIGVTAVTLLVTRIRRAIGNYLERNAGKAQGGGGGPPDSAPGEEPGTQTGPDGAPPDEP